MRASLSEAAVLRVVASLVAAERAQAGSGRAWDAAGWTADTSLGEDGLALDSLELLAASEVVGRFFRLHESGDETRLLAEATLGGWSRLVVESFALGAVDGFTFATSGTTGLPKLCRQTMAMLHGEAAAWSRYFTGRTRVVATVPPHHIYGFLFTVLLPDIAGLPVLDARMLPSDALRSVLRPGDLLIGHPTSLTALERTQGELPSMLRVVSATSGLSAASHRALLGQGAAEVTDVYGSTETAGIALRTDPDAPFVLLPRWQRGSDDTLTEVATGASHALPDRVEWEGERGLRPAARHDGAVQVAGVNVFPDRIAETLRGHAMVADCRVFLDTTLPEPRLRALLLPAPGCDPGETIADCDRWCRRRFSAPERPVGFEVSTPLPSEG